MVRERLPAVHQVLTLYRWNKKLEFCLHMSWSCMSDWCAGWLAGTGSGSWDVYRCFRVCYQLTLCAAWTDWAKPRVMHCRFDFLFVTSKWQLASRFWAVRSWFNRMQTAVACIRYQVVQDHICIINCRYCQSWAPDDKFVNPAPCQLRFLCLFAATLSDEAIQKTKDKGADSFHSSQGNRALELAATWR